MYMYKWLSDSLPQLHGSSYYVRNLIEVAGFVFFRGTDICYVAFVFYVKIRIISKDIVIAYTSDDLMCTIKASIGETR